MATKLVSSISEYFWFGFVVKSYSPTEKTENSLLYQTSSKADGIQAQVGHRLLVDWKILMRMASSPDLTLETQTNVKILFSEFSAFQAELENQSGPKQSLDRFLLLLINQEIFFFLFI